MLAPCGVRRCLQKFLCANTACGLSACHAFMCMVCSALRRGGVSRGWGGRRVGKRTSRSWKGKTDTELRNRGRTVSKLGKFSLDRNALGRLVAHEATTFALLLPTCCRRLPLKLPRAHDVRGERTISFCGVSLLNVLEQIREHCQCVQCAASWWYRALLRQQGAYLQSKAHAHGVQSSTCH